jgi:protein-disulfide isomerase
MDWDRLELPITDSDHARGPADAPVKLVHYGDYECPGCRRMNRLILKLGRPLRGKLLYVFRHFPLENTHPHALRAAEAAEAASAQGRFWEMHELLFANPDRLTDHDLFGYAGKLGLDVERFKREVDGSEYAKRILDEKYRALMNHVTGEPTFYLNGVLFAGSATELIEKIRTILNINPA